MQQQTAEQNTKSEYTDFLDKIELLISNPKNSYTIEELVQFLGTDSKMIILFLFTFIPRLPSPPWGFGFETIPGGVFSLIVSIIGLFGIPLDKLMKYLPTSIRNISLDVHILKQNRMMAGYYINKIKSVFRDRMKFIVNPVTEKLIYLLVIPFAILMMIPLILTNWFPSLSITFLSLSWLLNDGFFLIISIIVGALILLFYV